MSNRDLRPETIAAHALKAIDEATGCRGAADLHVLHLCPRRDLYAATAENYVRNGNPTLWQAEEAIAALGEGAGCAALCLRHGGDHHADRDGAAGCPCGGAGRDVLRHARLAEAAGGAGAHQRSRCSIRVQMAHWRRALQKGQDRSGVDRNAAQSHLGRDRHRGGGEGFACRGRHSRGGCHGHRRRDHAAADAGRGSRLSLRDQVSQRPLRRACGRAGDRRGEPTAGARCARSAPRWARHCRPSSAGC